MKAALTLRRNELGRKVRKDYELHKVKLRRSQLRDFTPRDDGICNTLTSVTKDNYIIESMDEKSILEGLENGQFRIRKLTPRECFRLMGVRETDIDKIQKTRFMRGRLVPADDQTNPLAMTISKSQQYKMAGNSIVVDCLFYIFRNLFIGVPEDEKDTLF